MILGCDFGQFNICLRYSLTAWMDFRLVSIFLLAFLCLFRRSEGAVTAWSSPASIEGSFGSATTTTVAENSAEGTTLFTAIATVSGTASYTLTIDANGKGSIDSGTGVVTLAAGQSINYETTISLVFVVVATDSSAGATGTATITVPITDVNEAPVFSAVTTTAYIEDNSAAGTTLETYTATDPDTGNTLSYFIASGNTNTDFSLVESTGVISVATGKTLSKASTATYALVVNAVDSAGTPLTGTTTVSVTVEGGNGTGALTAQMSFVILVLVATQLL